jgi:hypothetical protein
MFDVKPLQYTLVGHCGSNFHLSITPDVEHPFMWLLAFMFSLKVWVACLLSKFLDSEVVLISDFFRSLNISSYIMHCLGDETYLNPKFIWASYTNIDTVEGDLILVCLCIDCDLLSWCQVWNFPLVAIGLYSQIFQVLEPLRFWMCRLGMLKLCVFDSVAHY